MLPDDYDERKALPLYTFLMEYFPLAFLEVVRVSVEGDKQHLNQSEPGKIRWAREKSTDQLNTAMRHQFDYGTGQQYDKDGRAHLGKAIWRLMAQLQLDEEKRLSIIKVPRPPGHDTIEIRTHCGGGGAGGSGIDNRKPAQGGPGEVVQHAFSLPASGPGTLNPLRFCPNCGGRADWQPDASCLYPSLHNG